VCVCCAAVFHWVFPLLGCCDVLSAQANLELEYPAFRFISRFLSVDCAYE